MTFCEYLREHGADHCTEFLFDDLEEEEGIPEWVDEWEEELNNYGDYFEEVRTASDKIAQFEGENTLENVPIMGIFLASGKLGYWVKVSVLSDGKIWCVPYGNDSDDDWRDYTIEELTTTVFGADFDPTITVLQTQFVY